MKKYLAACISLLLAGPSLAQWKTTTYTLKGGWNAIYLNGDATYDTLDALLPSTVLEVWRWNPNPTQVGFTASPLIPSAGTAEWSVWKRNLPTQSNLAQLTGQTAYLVKCSGAASQSYTVGLKQAPQLPANSWVRHGANLLGFPSLKNGSSFPTMGSYFATFPAAIAVNARIYKYVGGDLGTGNPLQVFSPSNERLDSTQAYWFSAEVTGDYYAPLELSVSTSSGGFDFGRTGSTVTLRLRNRSAAAVTVTFAPAASESAPATQTAVAGSVALTRRSFNAVTGAWTEVALSGASTEAIGAQSTVELSFGIDRSAMAGAADAFYASLLRITESSNLMDVYLPVTAKKASLAGLWVGDINLNSVSSKVSNRAQATATLGNGMVSALSLSGSGGGGYTSPPAVTISAPASNGNSIATATATRGSEGTITALTSTSAGGGYTTAPTVTLSAPTASIAGLATASLGGGGVTSIAVATAGTHYASAPVVTVASPNPSARATATASVVADAVTEFAITSGGSNYAAVPTVTVTGGATNATATALLGVTANNFLVGSGTQVYYTAPGVVISGGGATTNATATAVLSSGLVTKINLTSGGAGYTSAPTLTFSGGTVLTPGTPPSAVGNAAHFNVVGVVLGTGGAGYTTAAVSIEAPPAAVAATATASVNAAGAITGFTVVNPGTGYTSAPTVAVAPPPNPIQATATATLTNDAVSGYTITNPGSGYLSAPGVTVGSPPLNQRATAIATLSGGSVTGLTLTSGGSGYTLAPSITIAAPPRLSGTAASGTYSVRTLLHVSDDGTARLLSKVDLGKLAAGSNDFGICTSQSLLQSSSLASARRLSSVHLPSGRVITGSGAVGLGGQLTCTITLPYNDRTNPFVHQFHPDHDNLNATFDKGLSEGVESYSVTRVGTFDFTASPPAGSSVTSGWGNSVIGGTYSEILSGLHSSSIQLGGTFELRRASELGTLAQ